MSSKNNKTFIFYLDRKKYYEQHYPKDSLCCCKPWFYAVCINHQDLFLSKEDCLEALKNIGYENPTFLGIHVDKSDKQIEPEYRSRAFFKFQLTPELNALITLANNLIFIIENKYDNTQIDYPFQNSSNDSEVFCTTFIYNKKGIRITGKTNGVLLMFELSYPNIIIQSLESSFIPLFPWDPDNKYYFSPGEDKNKIKNLLYAYYHAYYDKEVDLVQNLPTHYLIEA